MFLRKQVNRQLVRNKGRTILLICVAALLLAVLAFYLGNIRSNEDALRGLSDNIPVVVRVVNRSGSKDSALNIDTDHVDALNAAGMKNAACSAVAAGALSEEARRQEPFVGGDTGVAGVNALSALDLSDSDIAFADGWDSSFLTGTESACIVHADYAEANGISAGDSPSLRLYSIQYSVLGMTYTDIGEAGLTVIGTYEQPGGSSLIVPAAWLREQAEQAGAAFYYDSYRGELADSTRLTEFKQAMLNNPPYFLDTFEAQDQFTGDALSVEDELFVKTAGKLRQNVQAFRAFLVPFFALVIGLITLATFLVLRNCRAEMAVSISLGQSRKESAAPHFLAVLATDLIGCILALPFMVTAAGISVLNALLICLLFLLCACAGTSLALRLLLRFEPIALLTKVD